MQQASRHWQRGGWKEGESSVLYIVVRRTEPGKEACCMWLLADFQDSGTQRHVLDIAQMCTEWCGMFILRRAKAGCNIMYTYNCKYFPNIYILTIFMMITCMGSHWSSTLLGCMMIVYLDDCICSVWWHYMLWPSIWRINFLLIQSAIVHISIPGACVTAKASMDMQHCNAPIHIYIYQSACNVGRPLIKAVTPQNIANNLLRNLMVKTLVDYL